jgi:hypothetical protein
MEKTRTRAKRKIPVLLFVLGMVVGIALILISCAPTQPDVPAPPTANAGCNVTGSNNAVNCGSGNQTVSPPSPSPSPGTITAKPKLVKITQFGESCPDGVSPSGQDRAVRIGCTKALTLSPKCSNPIEGQPDIDCAVPPGAAPDRFEVVSGGDHIEFTVSQDNPGFNRIAKGKTAGFTVIGGAYAGVEAEPFVLQVLP